MPRSGSTAKACTEVKTPERTRKVPRSDSETSPSVPVSFSVSSRAAVDKLYTEVTDAGYKGQQEPYDAFWGARYAIIEDPDGNAVGLMSPIDPDRRAAPPSM